MYPLWEAFLEKVYLCGRLFLKTAILLILAYMLVSYGSAPDRYRQNPQNLAFCESGPQIQNLALAYAYELLCELRAKDSGRQLV